jgi:hypothetical protein
MFSIPAIICYLVNSLLEDKESHAMIELESGKFGLVEYFFSQKKQYIPALSVIHGKYPGRVFVDNELDPNVAIVWAINRWLYMEGRVSSEETKQSVYQFIRKVVIPDCTMRDENWFDIYTSNSKQWDELFKDGLENVSVEKHYESVYRLDIGKFNQVKSMTVPRMDELQIDIVDIHILPESYYDFKYVADKFKTMKSVGVEIRNENQLLVSTCSNNGLQDENEYFIDVDTYRDEDRGKGYATLASIKLINLLLAVGMNPLWETTHNNIPLHKLALKLGFEVCESYPVYAFIFEKGAQIQRG